MKILLQLSLLSVLAAWSAASPGASQKIDESALVAMRQGRTTFDEIVRRYGRPNFGSKMWDSRTAVYAYGEGWSPNALTAMGAALGGSAADTVVLHFNDRDVLVDYKINRAGANPGSTPGTLRYVEPSFGGTMPAPAAKPAPAAVPAMPTVRYVEPAPGGGALPAAKPAAAAAAKPAQATSIAPVPAGKPAAAQASKPEPRSDGLPWWLPSTSTRDERY